MLYQHTLKGPNSRGSIAIDTPLPKLDALKVLQLRINEANRLIFQGDPLVISDALVMEAKARAEVWKIVAHNAHELADAKEGA